MCNIIEKNSTIRKQFYMQKYITRNFHMQKINHENSTRGKYITQKFHTRKKINTQKNTTQKNYTQKYITRKLHTRKIHNTSIQRIFLQGQSNPGIWSHQASPICFQFQKSEKEKFKERQFHTTRKIKHTYNTFIQQALKTKFIQHKKIQHKVGVLGAGLAALRHSPR